MNGITWLMTPHWQTSGLNWLKSSNAGWRPLVKMSLLFYHTRDSGEGESKSNLLYRTNLSV